MARFSRPCAPTQYVIDAARSDAISSRQRPDARHSSEGFNPFNVHVCKFATGVVLAVIVGAMQPTIKSIFARRGPAKMLGVAAARIATAMSGVCAFGTGAVTRLTGDMVNVGSLAPHDYPVTGGCLTKRPYEARIGNMGGDRDVCEIPSRAVRDTTRKWVAILMQAFVMPQAVTKGLCGLVAIVNRAYRAVSHGAVLSRGGQGRALLKQRFRPDLCTRFTECSQEGLA